MNVVDSLPRSDSKQTDNRKKFTFPASLLFDFPYLWNNDDLAYLRQVYVKACDDYSFFRRISLPSHSRENVAPPLCFGLACLGSIYAVRPAEESRKLFLAGMNLWTVMMESDNREARSLDMITAVSLLVIKRKWTSFILWLIDLFQEHPPHDVRYSDDRRADLETIDLDVMLCSHCMPLTLQSSMVLG